MKTKITMPDGDDHQTGAFIRRANAESTARALFDRVQQLEKRTRDLERLCHRAAAALEAHLAWPADTGYTADAEDALRDLQGVYPTAPLCANRAVI